MNNLQDLHSLVSELESEYDEKKQIQILEQISKMLLTQYEIRIDAENIIQPLRVEAYYYPFSEPSKFCDPCAHQSNKKIGAFGKLYFIENKFGYPGIDLCLSQGDYYLSFLIKNSQIGEKCFKQTALSDRFSDRRDEIETIPNVLQKRAEPLVDIPVFNTSRVGLKTEGTRFAHELLAFLIDINRKENGKSVFNWEKGYGRQWTVAKYGLEKAQCDIEKAREIIKNENLYSSKIEDKYMNSALEYIKGEEK